MLTISKTSPISNATVGSTVTYTLNITNDGNFGLFDIFISDQLPSNLRFMSGSIKINGVSSPLDSILSGVLLGSLEPSKSSTITFDAEVISQPQNKDIVNIATGDFSYIDPVTSQTRFGTAISEPCTITINLVNLDVSKTSNKNIVSIGDIVTYTVTLANTGDVDLINAIFTDTLPYGLELINGTFTLNGSVINSVNLTTGVVIQSIPTGRSAIVTYQVKIISTNGCNAVNQAQASYRYILSDGSSGSGTSKSTPSSSFVLKTTLSNFKQLNIEEYLQIPKQKPDIETINSVDGKIDILKCAVIKTGASVSSEGQKLTNYKLVLQGLLHVVIEYTSCKSNQSVHSAYFNIPFSTFIVLPIDFVPGARVDPSGTIEDIYTKKIDNRRLFNNTTMLITAKVQTC